MFKGLWVGLRLFWCSPSKSRAGLIAISAALWLAFPAKPWLMAQTQGVATLRVRIDGARNARGEIVVLVFRDSNGFTNDGSKAVRTERVPIDAQTLSSQAVFEGLRQGVYAVTLFHDENRNGKLDTNFLRIPKEGYGFSNNPKKRAGPPPFDQAKLSLNQAECSIEVRLIYW
jgi:uncharacterized protein (DUF2141 family)